MTGKRMGGGKASSMPMGLAVGAMISMGITVVLAGILAYFMGKEVMQENAAGVGSVVILLAASALGAMTSFYKIKHRRLMVCLLSGVIYYLLLLACTALFFGGQYQGMGVTGLVILGGCGVVALAGLKGEKRGNHHRKKYVPR